eukprot:2260063-Rhodomonas_salina.2
MEDDGTCQSSFAQSFSTSPALSCSATSGMFRSVTSEFRVRNCSSLAFKHAHRVRRERSQERTEALSLLPSNEA